MDGSDRRRRSIPTRAVRDATPDARDPDARDPAARDPGRPRSRTPAIPDARDPDGFAGRMWDGTVTF
jgi:hypothetical protein